MKGKSLFKKIAAAATTVAMLASVSVVGFAAGTVTEGTVGGDGLANKVNANSITMTEVKSGDTVTGFTFTVDHSFGASKEETAKTIGYTMLAYKGVFSDTGYSGDGSNVVGIAQQTSATDNFEFTVAKAATAGTATRDLTYGDTMVVLLSSDDADGAVGYLYTLKAVATDAQYAGSTVDVTVPYDADDVAILTAVQGVVTGNITVDLGNVVESEFDTLESNVTATVKEVTAVADNKATVVIEAAEGSAYKTETDTTISVPLNIQKEAWTANDATYDEKVYVDPLEVDTVVEMTAAVKDALVGKSVTLKETTKSYTYAYTLEAADIETVEPDGTVEDSAVIPNATFTYNVTVPAETYDDGLVTVGEGGIKAAITVEVKADTRWAVDSAELQKAADSSDVTEITIEYADAPADKAALETAVAALVNGDTYKVVVNGKNAEEQDVTNVVTSDVTVVAVDEYTKPAIDSTEDVAVTVTVTVPTSATFATADTTKITEAKSFEIEVVVKAAGPAWECGDVNHDGEVDTGDVICILDYAVAPSANAYVYERLAQSDAYKDNVVDTGDAIAILDKIVNSSIVLPIVP